MYYDLCMYVNDVIHIFVLTRLWGKTWGLQKECQADNQSLRLLEKVGQNMDLWIRGVLHSLTETAVFAPHVCNMFTLYTYDSASHEGLYRKGIERSEFTLISQNWMRQFWFTET